MDATQYLQSARDKYVEWYRSIIRSKREEGAEYGVEVWVKPNIVSGSSATKEMLCVDLLVRGGEKPGMAMLSSGAVEGALISTFRISNTSVKIYPIAWEDFTIWVRHPDPHWTLLDPWKKKWMRADAVPNPDEDGLSGIAHYLSKPIGEGGGHLLQADFGSAPSDALLELIQVFADMGSSEVEVGRSDGSDLPPDVQAELRHPELSLIRLMGIITRLLVVFEETIKVERINDEQITVSVKGRASAPHIFLGNLYRLLQRTGVEGRAKEVYRFMRGQRESMGPAIPPDLSQLRVVIKDNRFLENIRQLSPKMKSLVKKQLVADLWIVCVWDTPNGMRFATEDEPGKYGLSSEEILDRSKKNYLEVRPPVNISKHGPLLIAQTQDCYDASLLVDDGWIEEISGKVDGDLLACAPARNMVMLGGARQRGTIDEMRRAAQRIEAGGDHLITDTILVRKDGHWLPLQETKSTSTADTQPPSNAQEQKAIPISPPKRPWWKFW